MTFIKQCHLTTGMMKFCMFYLLLLGTGLLKFHIVTILATTPPDNNHLWYLALTQRGMLHEIVTLLKPSSLNFLHIGCRCMVSPALGMTAMCTCCHMAVVHLDLWL